MQIKAITNREVKPGGLPSGVGCNVISTQTAYAIYRACYEGMPSIERVLTVAGSAMGDKSYNLQCRFGTRSATSLSSAAASSSSRRRSCSAAP